MACERFVSGAIAYLRRTNRSRGQTAMSEMRPDVVVVLSPKAEFASGIAQGNEDFFIEKLISKPCVKALDEAVFLRLAGGDIVPSDASLALPVEHGSGCELGSVVRDNRLRLAIEADDPAKFTSDPNTRE